MTSRPCAYWNDLQHASLQRMLSCWYRAFWSAAMQLTSALPAVDVLCVMTVADSRHTCNTWKFEQFTSILRVNSLTRMQVLQLQTRQSALRSLWVLLAVLRMQRYCSSMYYSGIVLDLALSGLWVHIIFSESASQSMYETCTCCTNLKDTYAVYLPTCWLCSSSRRLCNVSMLEHRDQVRMTWSSDHSMLAVDLSYNSTCHQHHVSLSVCDHV